MQQPHEPTPTQYPHGRGYGHDYMRGGEVLGGYGYAARDDYERPRGEIMSRESDSGSPESELPEP